MKRPLYRHPGPAAARLDVTVPDQPDPSREIDVLRWLAQMQADVAESLGGTMLRACRAVPVGTTTAGTVLVSASPGRLVGWSLHETSGLNPFLVRYRNGTDVQGSLIGCAAGSAGGVDNQWRAPGGISFTDGLFVELVTGGSLSTAVEGVVYLGSAD